MKHLFAKIGSISMLFAPLAVFAQVQVTNVETLIRRVQGIMNTLIPLILIIATIVFIWGVVTVIISSGDAEKRKEGRDLVMYGLLGLFVISAVWGLVAIIGNTISTPTITQPKIAPPTNLGLPAE